MPDEVSAQQDFWDKRAAAWERRTAATEAFSDAYGAAALEALGAKDGDRVIDIGCGPGATAVELARRVGPVGEVVALDISPAMIDAARRRVDAAGVANVRCVVHDLESAPAGSNYDGAFSRFGVMFFPAPERAFANIAASLRPSGRFACTVWGPLPDNPWMFVPTLASSVALEAELTLPAPGEPGPFSLADPERFRALLEGAGFEDVVVTPLTGVRTITTAAAEEELRALLEVGPVGEAFERANPTSRQRAIDAVKDAIERYREGDTWQVPGSAFAVSATRRP